MFWQKKSSSLAHVLKAKFIINGMHCVSCSLNVDGALEDTKGIRSAVTSYAKGETLVQYDPDTVVLLQIQKIIEKLGYTVVSVTPAP